MKNKKRNQWILIIGIIIAIVGFLLGVKKLSNTQYEPTTVVSMTNSSIEIANNNIDLGDIPIKGGKVNAEFSFRNTGENPITLTQGQTSCMCTEAVVERDNGEVTSRIKMKGHGSSGDLNMVIEPGEEATLIAIYDPMAHGPNALGPIQRDVYVNTNSSVNPELRFTFSGNVIR